MPLDVIMPALGMAQETGVIVAWHKSPGDEVAAGDVLFEVETDKATMEVEAQGAGYLSGVVAGEGDEIPVGNVIARITDSPEADAATEASATEVSPEPAGAQTEDLPKGREVIMPTLGMAQDSGLLVGWLVEPGATVGADDPLFEVETDKSTMEVPAGFDGYLAACLAESGEDVPTGQVIAIISAEAPAQTVTRSAKGSSPAPASADAAEKPAAPAPAKAAQRPSPAPAAPAVPPTAGGRILASPKARRLALEQGLDLSRLVTAGYPQPYHVKDIDVLKAMPEEAEAARPGATAAASRRLTADLPAEGFTGFAVWAAETANLGDSEALLAGLAASCLGTDSPVIVVEHNATRRMFHAPKGPLGTVTEIDDGVPDLILRDLRRTRVTQVSLGAEEAPTMSLTSTGDGLSLTLECDATQLAAPAAVSLISEFAGRLEHPLRQLL